MKILIAGAGGIIGSRLVSKILPDIGSDEYEYLVALDNEDQIPLFEDGNFNIWIKKNLYEMTADDWSDIVQDKGITRIYYLNSIDNMNMFAPDSMETIDKLAKADNAFIDFLNNIFSAPEASKLDVLYLSTDKIYMGDDFPNEKHAIYLDMNIDDNDDVGNLIKNYATTRILAEVRLMSLDMINLRIIRPFAIVAPENQEDFPLTKVILQAMYDVDLEIFGKGYQGLTFTHINDLVEFLLEPNLFSPEIFLLLSSKIINFSRVWNYLSEYLLYRKLKDKLDSNSSIVPLTETHTFKYIMYTPQIRNMVKISIPKITIEEIIEEIAYARTPQNTYDPLIIKRTYYTESNILHIAGTGQPGGVVYIILSTGQIGQQTILENGIWDVEFNVYEQYDPNDELTAEVRIISPEGIQYQTEHIDLPKPSEYSEPEISPLIVRNILYKFTEGSEQRPYLYFEGSADPGSTINIKIPQGSTFIYLSTKAALDEGGYWEAKTLPPYYMMEQGHTGTINAVLEDGSIYATYSFEVPVTPSSPPAQPPKSLENPVVTIQDIRYLQEIGPMHRTYLQISGVADPFSKIEIEVPGSSDSNEGTVIRRSDANGDGKWQISLDPPYYQREPGVQGTVRGFYPDGALYYMSSFEIPKTDDDLLPPEPQPIADLEIIETKYVFQNSKPRLYIKGKGEPNYKIKLIVDTIELETVIAASGIWEIWTQNTFINLDENKYADVYMLTEDNLTVDSIKFLVPISPISEPPYEGEEQFFIDTIRLIPQSSFSSYSETFPILELKGRAIPGGSIELIIPKDIYGISTTKYTSIVDSEGNWQIRITLEFYIDANHEFMGKATALDASRVKYAEKIFKLPDPIIHFPFQ